MKSCIQYKHPNLFQRIVRVFCRSRRMLVLGVLLLSVAYILEVNAVSTRGYAIQGLERDITALKQEQQSLELQVAQDQSIAQIQTRVAALNMVPTDHPVYVALPRPAVAMR